MEETFDYKTPANIASIVLISVLIICDIAVFIGVLVLLPLKSNLRFPGDTIFLTLFCVVFLMVMAEALIRNLYQYLYESIHITDDGKNIRHFLKDEVEKFKMDDIEKMTVKPFHLRKRAYSLQSKGSRKLTRFYSNVFDCQRLVFLIEYNTGKKFVRSSV
ncbi:MAG: hypothetical protein M1536_03105 [Firmicutes bacterium]|nr:hypothetical protein [Bacillota bacterium]